MFLQSKKEVKDIKKIEALRRRKEKTKEQHHCVGMELIMTLGRVKKPRAMGKLKCLV